MRQTLKTISAVTARAPLVLFVCLLAAGIPEVVVARQKTAESLLFDLKSPQPERRRDAARELGNRKLQQATPDLVAAAADTDSGVRKEVVEALDKMLDPRALPAFVTLSADPDKDIREKCLKGIVHLYLPRETGLGARVSKVANFLNPWSDEWAEVIVDPGTTVDPGAISALQARLQDSDEEIRIKTARALGILRAKGAVPAMLGSVRDDRSNPVRFELIRSLRKINDPVVAKDLMNFITYSDSKIREEAVFTLGRLRYREAVPEFARLFERESSQPAKSVDKAYRERLLDALAFIGDPAAKELFVKEQMNTDDLLRLHAFEGLARIGDPAMVTDVSRNRLREKDQRIRTAQAYALYRMGRNEYLDEVVNALSDRKSRDVARQYLVECKREELPLLYAQIKNKDVGVREGLAEVFGLIGDSNAVPVLQELAKDERGDIAAYANQAIRRINARMAVQ